MDRLEMKPLGGGIVTGLAASLCCGGSLIFGSIGLGAFFSTLGLWRYIPQILGIGALSIAAVNYVFYRRAARCRATGQSPLRRHMLISAVIGFVAMAVGFVFLEWFNHAVMHPHQFLTRTEYGSALIPGVPNARLLYVVAATIIGVGLLWGLPFPSSEGVEPASARRRSVGLAVSVVAMIALLTLVIGAFPRGGSMSGPGGAGHVRQHK